MSFTTLEDAETRLAELRRLLADPRVIADQARFQELAREHSRVEEVVEVWGALELALRNGAGARELIEKEGTWDEGLKAYTELFRKEFGEYDLSDFEYSFSGDADAGEVSIVYQGRTLPGLRVVREGGEWKLDEK